MEKSQVERKLLFQHFLVSQLKSTEEREPLLPPSEYDSYLHLLQRSQTGPYEELVSTREKEVAQNVTQEISEIFAFYELAQRSYEHLTLEEKTKLSTLPLLLKQWNQQPAPFEIERFIVTHMQICKKVCGSSLLTSPVRDLSRYHNQIRAYRQRPLSEDLFNYQELKNLFRR